MQTSDLSQSINTL